MKIYARKFPHCKHSPMATIQYGFPDMPPNMMEDLDFGKIALGGCSIFADSTMPKWKYIKPSVDLSFINVKKLM